MLLSKTSSKTTPKTASKKSKLFSVVLVLLLCVSIALALYPTISKKINTALANSSVNLYTKSVDAMPKSQINEMFREAEQYNAELANTVRKDDTPIFNPKENYNNILNVSGNGIMGSIEIPVIDVRLPIYHGTDDEFLDEGAGHLIGTSFPIGGQNTHAVISAHTALPGKLFFDRLTDVKQGDIFYVKILDRELEYRVTDIQVVLPSESQSLSIVKDKDLVTLVTCTPYSINSHRLLVTGERIEKSDTLAGGEDETITANTDSLPTKSNNLHHTIIMIGIAVLLIVFTLIVIATTKRKKKTDEKTENE